MPIFQSIWSEIPRNTHMREIDPKYPRDTHVCVTYPVTVATPFTVLLPNSIPLVVVHLSLVSPSSRLSPPSLSPVVIISHFPASQERVQAHRKLKSETYGSIWVFIIEH